MGGNAVGTGDPRGVGSSRTHCRRRERGGGEVGQQSSKPGISFRKWCITHGHEGFGLF